MLSCHEDDCCKINTASCKLKLTHIPWMSRLKILHSETYFVEPVPVRVYLTINVPVVYMARDVMTLMGNKSISRAIGRGGP